MSLGNHLHNEGSASLSRGVPASGIAGMLIEGSETITARKVNKSTGVLDDAVSEVNRAKVNILKAHDELHEKMESLSKKGSEAVKRSKDTTAQMTDSMNKMTKILGPEFDKRIAQLESITDCLERLSIINDTGKLSAVIAALGGK